MWRLRARLGQCPELQRPVQRKRPLHAHCLVPNKRLSHLLRLRSGCWSRGGRAGRRLQACLPSPPEAGRFLRRPCCPWLALRRRSQRGAGAVSEVPRSDLPRAPGLRQERAGHRRGLGGPRGRLGPGQVLRGHRLLHPPHLRPVPAGQPPRHGARWWRLPPPRRCRPQARQRHPGAGGDRRPHGVRRLLRGPPRLPERQDQRCCHERRRGVHVHGGPRRPLQRRVLLRLRECGDQRLGRRRGHHGGRVLWELARGRPRPGRRTLGHGRLGERPLGWR
mmetsp:Transcript_76660/g.228505  ORF Transcript_76660/g.228505 Transcript_76660/m.228505 type:complete len:277 (+) Transcript_76660:176-1006(+)